MNIDGTDLDVVAKKPVILVEETDHSSQSVWLIRYSLNQV